MSLNVTIVVGNPKPQSRTRRVAELLVANLVRDDEHTVTTIDLADYAGSLFAWPSEDMSALNARVAESDLVVFASPTYKATFTGLLKAFLDRYPANGLAGVVALPVLTGADSSHSMGPTHNLAPLLAELGAIVPGRGFHLPLTQFDHLEEVVAAGAAEYASNLARLARVAGGVVDAPLTS